MLQSVFNGVSRFCTMRRSANPGGIAKYGRMNIMSLKTTLIVGGLAAALGTGGAFAQSYSDNPPPSQEAPYGHHHQHGRHHGVLALIREEVSAGRIGRKEGMLLEQKIKEMKRERHAERQARYEGVQSRGSNGQGYDQGNPPPSQQPPR
jgi:hypothetical protein